MNTKKSGSLNFFIFKEAGDSDYTGVCFELGIVVEGADPEMVKKDLEESAHGYVIAVCKNNLSEDLLNQFPPKEYLDLFKKYLGTLNALKVRPSLTRRSAVRQPAFESASVFTQRVGDLCPAA